MKGQGVAGAIFMLVFAVILIVGVLVPITVETVSAASLTGIASTIADFLPIFAILGALAAFFGLVFLFMGRQ